MSRLTRFEPKYNCYVYNKGYAMGRKAKQKLGKIEDVLEAHEINGVEELEIFLDYCDKFIAEKEKEGENNGN